MGKIITDPSGLVSSPIDPSWHKPATRLEVQKFANILSETDEVLYTRSETAFIVINFLAEKLGVTKEELEAYVERKKAEAAEYKAKAEAKTKETEGAQASGPNV